MDFLTLFHECIELCNSSKRQFVHEVDLVGIAKAFVPKVFYHKGKCCRKQHNLTIGMTKVEDLFNDGLKFWRKKFVSFIHDNSGTIFQICNRFAGQIKNSSRRCNNNVNYRLILPASYLADQALRYRLSS